MSGSRHDRRLYPDAAWFDGAVSRSRSATVLAALLPAVLAAGCGVTFGGGDVPVGAQCRSLAKEERPGLKFEASRLLKDDPAVRPSAECDEGGYATVSGFDLPDPPEAVVARMQKFGHAEEIKDTECLDYLKPSVCGQSWQYTSDESGETYVVEMPMKEHGGEFSLAVQH